eukprot:TRINITY_DN7685_c0_g1::TRINITY_DN7685_c0_g1_i1::g.18662::m.18662 TRINITY_DN7685_c0_g1::TRINITY_DN7685_c0_g1_i1::g.18662  ORF type:complete len:792 (-),score=204.80,sp/Q8LGH4/CUL4_ARATH/54.59/0.0,Cullin/PF00888.17/3.4e-161,Cullin_Nedd8/PF10557.4/2.1e+03,Cullin_Nedd8/PF10557.4/1.4e-26 TRINITY_DN7685_c0_g1_i1:237-2612(-)
MSSLKKKTEKIQTPIEFQLTPKKGKFDERASSPTTITSAPSAVSGQMSFQSESTRPMIFDHGTSKPTNAPKKLVIKPFKTKPQLPENFEEDMWCKLRDAVLAIQTTQGVQYPQEELYRAAEDLCFHGKAQVLYQRLFDMCDAHVRKTIENLQSASPDPLVFLNHVESTWNDHCHQFLTIRSIFCYLDRTYVIQTTGVKGLWEMGLGLFRKYFQSIGEVEDRARKGILMLIELERMGTVVNRSLLKTLLRMLWSLTIYVDSFEKYFLAATSTFYAAEASKSLEVMEVPVYLKHVDHRLNEEGDRVTHYLDPVTRKPLISVVEKQLLENHTQRILDKGFSDLMDGNRRSDLALLYQLFSRVQALQPLKRSFAAYIKKVGTAYVNDEEREKTLVQDLLDLKHRLDLVLRESFLGNDAFEKSLKESFEHSVNAKENKPAELIAKYLDVMLRAGNKGQTDEEMDQLLDRVMVLFRYIQGKDIFEAFYKKDLAKRLLLGKSASFDTEKAVISKLKAECGSGFTNKLEGMFKDIDLSSDIMSSFRQTAYANDPVLRNVEINVSVLTTGVWPAYPPMEVKLPHELAQFQEIFKRFYLSKYHGRTLQWLNSHGQCSLKARFPKGAKDLQVSLFQAVVLLMFNDGDDFNFVEIKQYVGIETQELKRTLLSLACGKPGFRVLRKTPAGPDIKENDKFSFNTEFTQKFIKIKINQIQLKETPEENQQTQEKVIQDRHYQIDAALVRIMKARKTLSHNLLISEVCEQLKFPMKAQDIKKRIESLIEREYLERDKANPQIYNYLA